MSSEFSRQSLSEAIHAVRAARDASARTAERFKETGASRLGIVLDALAAEYDKDLAQLLKEDARLAYRHGHVPEAAVASTQGF